MKTFAAKLGALALVAMIAQPVLAGGSVKAKAKFDGERPRRTVLKMDADQYCAKANEKKVGSEEAIVSKEGMVKNVIVYVKDGLGDAEFEVPTEKAELNQQGCMYHPHVQALQAKQPMIVKNSDATLHNIHSFAEKQKAFNFAQPKQGDEKEVTFSRPEIVKIKCDVHPWMSAYVGVFDHPFHAVTEKDGDCEIANLPPGEYTLAAWHETFGEVEQKVTVADGEAAEVEFVFKAK
ncbi:MAG TPA: carboxypeptidase regulatory-like domain-containing protein [Phycisphaerae bacterium]|nr:carboxypeptidase regulatory-like domain-containing protein [Phycisphaerae bacterium]